MQHVGGAADIRAVQVPQLGQAQIVRHVERPEARRGAGAEIAVDVVLGEAGVLQRAARHLGMELRHRLVLGLARRVLEGAHDVGLAVDAHGRTASVPGGIVMRVPPRLARRVHAAREGVNPPRGRPRACPARHAGAGAGPSRTDVPDRNPRRAPRRHLRRFRAGCGARPRRAGAGGHARRHHRRAGGRRGGSDRPAPCHRRTVPAARHRSARRAADCRLPQRLRRNGARTRRGKLSGQAAIRASTRSPPRSPRPRRGTRTARPCSTPSSPATRPGARIGMATRLRPAAHPHGTWGTLGAAAAVARLRNHDAPTTARVLEVAASLGLATSATAALRGGSVRNAYAGSAAQNGMLACDLAEAGVAGEPAASRRCSAASWASPSSNAPCCRASANAGSSRSLLQAGELLPRDPGRAGSAGTAAGRGAASRPMPSRRSRSRPSPPPPRCPSARRRRRSPAASPSRSRSPRGSFAAMPGPMRSRHPPSPTRKRARSPRASSCGRRRASRPACPRNGYAGSRCACETARCGNGVVVGTPGDPDRPLPEAALRGKFRRCAETALGPRWEMRVARGPPIRTG